MTISRSLEFLTLNMRTIDALRREHDSTNAQEADLAQFLSECQPNNWSHIFTLTRHLKRLQQHLDHLNAQSRKARHQDRIKFYQDDPHSRRAFKAIRAKVHHRYCLSNAPTVTSRQYLLKSMKKCAMPMRHTTMATSQDRWYSMPFRFFPSTDLIFFPVQFSRSSPLLGKIS